MGTVRYTTINGEVIAQKRNGVRRQFIPDPLGSTVAMLDNTRTITGTFSYWPYGEIASRAGGTVTPFQFVGTAGYYQDAPGRSYVRARHLDSTAGRWITQDPIGLLGGLNMYQYVRSSPAFRIDPSGLDIFVIHARDSSGHSTGGVYYMDIPRPFTDVNAIVNDTIGTTAEFWNDTGPTDSYFVRFSINVWNKIGTNGKYDFYNNLGDNDPYPGDRQYIAWFNKCICKTLPINGHNSVNDLRGKAVNLWLAQFVVG